MITALRTWVPNKEPEASENGPNSPSSPPPYRRLWDLSCGCKADEMVRDRPVQRHTARACRMYTYRVGVAQLGGV